MEKTYLKGQKRTVTGGKVSKLRKAGVIPAVMYGHKIAAQNLALNYLEFQKVFQKAGENTVIELEIEGGEKANVLVHDVQLDAMDGKISHVDLFQVRMDEKIETKIPLEFVGEAPAVKALGGVLVKNMDEVEVSCFPADLPSTIQVDIAQIVTFDIHIKVKDLKVSDKVEIMSDMETVIALVERPRTEEELAALNEKVEADVTKVEGVVKPEAPAAEGEGEAKKEKK
jgi:large subunit ribosomal protein L25